MADVLIVGKQGRMANGLNVDHANRMSDGWRLRARI